MYILGHIAKCIVGVVVKHLKGPVLNWWSAKFYLHEFIIVSLITCRGFQVDCKH